MGYYALFGWRIFLQYCLLYYYSSTWYQSTAASLSSTVLWRGGGCTSIIYQVLLASSTSTSGGSQTSTTTAAYLATRLTAVVDKSFSQISNKKKVTLALSIQSNPARGLKPVTLSIFSKYNNNNMFQSFNQNTLNFKYYGRQY